MDRRYSVTRSRAIKLWVPYNGLRWPPPRFIQLLAIVFCRWRGHVWTNWSIDDIDGPGEWHDGYFMPLLSRLSEEGEFGIRSCSRCQAIERRIPVG